MIDELYEYGGIHCMRWAFLSFLQEIGGGGDNGKGLKCAESFPKHKLHSRHHRLGDKLVDRTLFFQ